MFPFYSFLQTVMQVLRGLVMPVVKVSKQMYRSTTVITAGCTVVAVVVFTASGFGAGGKSALTAFAEGRFEESEEALEEPEAEGLDLITEAKIQAELTSLRQESRLVGERLVENTVRQQKASEEAKAELKAKKQKIQEEKEAEARARAEEEARKKAEEERRAALRIPYIPQDYQVMLKIV